MFFLHDFNHSVTVQTIPSLKAVLEGPDQVGIERTHTVDYICIYKGVQIKPNPNTSETDQLQHDCPAACVIAQQIPPATYKSLYFQSQN